MVKLRFIAYLHYRFDWPLFKQELLDRIPAEWKLDKCYALYDPVWSWCNAQHNRTLQIQVINFITQL